MGTSNRAGRAPKKSGALIIQQDSLLKVIAYYRVSTRRQGDSGLGLEGQRAAVEAFARARGAQIIGSYTEVESGAKADRVELARALGHAKRSRTVLVVAKLDRLARNVAFLSALMESSVEFMACDNPHASRLTVHILAAVAEDEARRISERTKAALAAYKARGGQLGARHPRGRPLTAEARRKGSLVAGARARASATEAYGDIAALLGSWRRDGMTLATIARKLDELGHTTRGGRTWNHVQVARVLKRLGLQARLGGEPSSEQAPVHDRAEILGPCHGQPRRGASH